MTAKTKSSSSPPPSLPPPFPFSPFLPWKGRWGEGEEENDERDFYTREVVASLESWLPLLLRYV